MTKAETLRQHVEVGGAELMRVLSLLVMIPIAGFALTGYAVGVTWLYTWSPIPMAVNTALGLFLLSIVGFIGSFGFANGRKKKKKQSN